MRILLLLALLAATFATRAQDTTVQNLRTDASRKINRNDADTVPEGWRAGGIASVNLSQGSLSNWAAGGDDYSLTVTSLVSLYAFYKKGRNNWDNTLDFNYGIVNTTSLGSRKNDDRFDVLSKYGYALEPKWNAAVLGNFRTQFFKGYTYTNEVQTLASDFLSPAYLLLSVGLDFRPAKDLSLYLSPLTGRWTFVNDDTLSAKGEYGVAPGENVRSEIGAFFSASYIKAISKVLGYRGRLDLFSNYQNNPQNIDVYMTNLLTVKFTKVLSATWNVDLIYDDDVRLFGPEKTSPALQLKSLIGVGLLVKFGNAKKDS